MKKIRKTIIYILCVAIILNIAAFPLFTALEHNHDCVGDGCYICSALLTFKELFKTVTAVITLYILLITEEKRCHLTDKKNIRRIFSSDPISLKVKLTN